MKRRTFCAGLAAGAAPLGLTRAWGAGLPTPSQDTFNIGVLSDMSGVYASIGGPGSVVAAQMAIEDFGSSVLGKPIALVTGDHQNKPDLAVGLLREWYDNGQVRMVTDLLNSAVALASIGVAREKNRMALVTGAADVHIVGDHCTPNSALWVYNTYSWATITGQALVKQGFDSWYFITADYAFGKTMEQNLRDLLQAAGGKVLGAARAPLGTQDFGSFLVSAQSSGSKVVALINSGADTVNSVKQAAEFGITKSAKVALFGVYVTDIDAIGLAVAQNLVFAAGFYWDRTPESRAWSKRFFARYGRMPSDNQAGIYSATTQYLKAVATVGTDDAAQVMKQLKSAPINDMFAQNGRLREDGLLMHDMFLVQAKTPAESKYPWDYFNILATVPGSDNAPQLAQSACPLVKT